MNKEFLKKIDLMKHINLKMHKQFKKIGVPPDIPYANDDKVYGKVYPMTIIYYPNSYSSCSPNDIKFLDDSKNYIIINKDDEEIRPILIKKFPNVEIKLNYTVSDLNNWSEINLIYLSNKIFTRFKSNMIDVYNLMSKVGSCRSLNYYMSSLIIYNSKDFDKITNIFTNIDTIDFITDDENKRICGSFIYTGGLFEISSNNKQEYENVKSYFELLKDV